MFELNKIYNMDCLEFMQQVPDKYFDLVLTDPPYGINADIKQNKQAGKNRGNGKTKVYKSTNWDGEIPSIQIFDEIFRISKNQIIWGGNYMYNLPISRNWVIWDKKQSLTQNDGEVAWSSIEHNIRIYRKSRIDAYVNDGEQKVHPTQKPTGLIRYCLEVAKAEKHWKVFDPFMGSGTTAVACESLADLELEWCGCETEPDYVAIANKRLEQVQGSLF